MIYVLLEHWQPDLIGTIELDVSAKRECGLYYKLDRLACFTKHLLELTSRIISIKGSWLVDEKE